jgi:hypothetical protein
LPLNENASKKINDFTVMLSEEKGRCCAFMLLTKAPLPINSSKLQSKSKEFKFMANEMKMELWFK